MIQATTPSFLPSFFVLGNNFGPCDVVSNILNLHHNIFVPDTSGNYFSSESAYRKGLGSYYLRFTDADKQALIGDFSQRYFFYTKKFIQRLRFLYNEQLKDLKVIVCLGNPYSQFIQSAICAPRYDQDSYSLPAILKLETQYLADEWFFEQGRLKGLSISLSIYAQRIRCLKDSFGEEQVLVIYEQQLIENPFQCLLKMAFLFF